MMDYLVRWCIDPFAKETITNMQILEAAIK